MQQQACEGEDVQPGGQPAPDLLGDDRPWRQVVGQQAPLLGAGPHQGSQPVADSPLGAVPRRAVFAHQREDGATKAHSSSVASLGHGVRPCVSIAARVPRP